MSTALACMDTKSYKWGAVAVTVHWPEMALCCLSSLFHQPPVLLLLVLIPLSVCTEQLCVNTLRQELPWFRDSSDFTSGKADSHCFWCAGCTFSQSSSTHSWGGFIYTTQYPQDTHYFIHLTSASIGGISAHSKEEEIFDIINTLFTFKLNVGFHSNEK